MRGVFAGIGSAAVLTACAQSPAPIDPSFDTCLIENMAAVRMLTEEIETLEGVGAQQALAGKRESLIAMTDDLLAWRMDQFADERIDESEAARQMSTMMSRYANGANTRIAAAKSDGLSGSDLSASSCACVESME